MKELKKKKKEKLLNFDAGKKRNDMFRLSDIHEIQKRNHYSDISITSTLLTSAFSFIKVLFYRVLRNALPSNQGNPKHKQCNQDCHPKRVIALFKFVNNNSHKQPGNLTHFVHITEIRLSHICLQYLKHVTGYWKVTRFLATNTASLQKSKISVID